MALVSSSSELSERGKKPPPPPSPSNNKVRVAKVALLIASQLPLYSAFPIMHAIGYHYSPSREDAFDMEGIDTSVPGFWTNMAVSAFLVVLGGVFAGLTLGLMGQDEVYLQVMEQSGDEAERKAAKRVLSLLKRGKHWVLVTLLLSNVITNETLPIVLDRCLGGGWPAVVSSTVAIVIFGEIIPQSLCVRYGLSVGAMCAPFVICLMYFMFPVAYPVSMLLDYVLGEDHGTIYKKAGLKTLVTLHKNMGVERLNEDEVTIISAVLDLKEKPVGSIMTPMEDVFVMSSDRILDEKTIEEILHTGFNRIPIHAPGEPENFIGMLLVRILITYDPEDALPISSFPLATLPETGPDTSCLNILNYFQEGKSHMVIVSQNPGDSNGAMGVLTLEDVIEELIGEEIIDESDVYVDVHKAIRRTQPGPLTKRISGIGGYYVSSPKNSFGLDPVFAALADPHQYHDSAHGGHSEGFPRIKLGPSNKASNPRMTGNRNVHIKTAQLDRQREQDILRHGSVSAALHGEAKKSHHDHERFYDDDDDDSRRSTGVTLRKNSDLISPTNTNTPTADPSQMLSSSNGTQIAVHRSETDAVRNAIDGSPTPRLNIPNSHNVSSRNSVSDTDLAVAATQPSEVHSYRTGGIVESVVNVQGINKTVIEDISDEDLHTTTATSSDEDLHRYKTSRSSSSKKSKNSLRKDKYNETDPLLNGSNNENGYASTSPRD
jgi:metal transporter CNNM